MRLSTANTYDATIANLQRRQLDLSESQQRLSSLKRVNRASDDPTAAARAERALALEARTDASQRAVDASSNAMALGESALGDAEDLLQQARETIVKAGNGTYSDAERQSQALNLRQIREQLLQVANRPDGSGSYIFGGQGASSPPFIETPSGVTFRGIGGQIDVASGESLPVSIDGAASFLQAPTGNGVFETTVVQQKGTARIDTGVVTDPSAVTGKPYSITFTVSGGTTTYTVLKDGAATAMTNVPYSSDKAIEIDGQSVTISGDPANGDQFDIKPSTASLNVFDLLDKTAAALETRGQTSAQTAQTVALALRDIDSSHGRVISQRGLTGETMQRIENATNRLSATKLAAQTDRSNAEDIDQVAAYSDFNNQQTGFDAALKSYASVQKLSLFQYLNV